MGATSCQPEERLALSRGAGKEKRPANVRHAHPDCGTLLDLLIIVNSPQSSLAKRKIALARLVQ
jgi:hypothetical protein